LIEGMKGTGLTVLYGGGQPAYAPLTDTVKMPLPDRFHTTQDYAATMLHELAHASGNKQRLDRLNLYARFGSEEYSREELVAELSSAFLGAQLGMPMAASMMESHASYMASWLTVLKRDKNEIFRAAAAAQKVADYLGQWAIKPSLEVAPDASQARPSEGQRHEADARAPMKLGR
jgi:antirestriction protein ArdC